MTVLYCYVNSSSFVRKDLEILRSEHEVITVTTGRLSKSKIIWSLVKQGMQVFSKMRQCDVVLVQGAGHHSFLPSLLAKLYGRPCYITIIGVDGSSFPKIGYGNFTKQPLKALSSWSLKLATTLLPIHDALRYQNYDYAPEGSPRQGYEAFIPDLKTPSKVVQRGYDSNRWQSTGIIRKEKSFLTVVSFFNSSSIIPLKGLDLIFEVAKELPDCSFTIAGLESHHFDRDLPSNIHFMGRIPHDDMPSVFSSATYYMQLSMSEGFGNSLCESMLCECVPIGSSVNAIPEIIGDNGFILERKDVSLLKGVIEQALQADSKTLGAHARARVMANYPKQRRKSELLAVLGNHKV